MGKLGELLQHPDELAPLLGMYMAARRATVLPKDSDLAFCYSILNQVSRSFAIVIQQLPQELRDAICVFYLVLRGLDTVEDDMAIPQDIKLPLLHSFHQKSYEEDWSMECGTGGYAELMRNYFIVGRVFRRLKPEYQQVISDICKRMGDGMAEFIVKEVETVEEYDLYCHYVAGLVGIGLSNMFVSSGLESEQFCEIDDLSNGMGLFLQKTNIIRDYLEDIEEEPAPRMFWPKEIWGKHADKLEDFKRPENADAAVTCLNDMIADAMRHVDASLDYLKKLKNRSVFRFCAIPQIMAMGTLACCFNNHNVFTGVVKMRRGETAKIMSELGDYADSLVLFRKYANQMVAKAKQAAPEDEGARRAAEAAARLSVGCSAALADLSRAENERRARESRVPLKPTARAVLLVVALGYFYIAYHPMAFRRWAGLETPEGWLKLDYYNQIIAAMLLGYTLYAAVTGQRP